MQNEPNKLNQKIKQLENQNKSLLAKLDRMQSFESNYNIVNTLCNRQQDLIAAQNDMIKQLQAMLQPTTMPDYIQADQSKPQRPEIDPSSRSVHLG